MENTNRIKYALYLEKWDYETGDKEHLRKHADKVLPLNYLSEMKGNIFCPECSAGLFRSPENREYDSSGRKAFYAHTRKHTPECSLRTKRTEGRRYETEEQATQAIENGKLVIIKCFMKEKPLSSSTDGPVGHLKGVIEGGNGGLLRVPLGKHKGEEYNLPSEVATIRGISRDFDNNLHRYFLLPGNSEVFLLQDLLINVASVTERCDTPKIYYGKVTNSTNRGRTPQNIRQTMLEYEPNEDCVDFCLKTTDEDSRYHGIDDDSTGTIVLMYGKVTKSGIGLCIEHLGWGEFAVLPVKYADLLYSLFQD